MARSKSIRICTIAAILGMTALQSSPSIAASCGASTESREGWKERLRAAVLRVAPYPTDRSIRAYLDLSAVPESAVLVSATLHVEPPAGSGRPVLEFPLNAADAVAPGGSQTILRLPELPPGNWRVRARVGTRDCASIEGPTAEFVVERFAWEGNRLGRETAVIPPLTALEVEGVKVRSVLREHAFAGNGLWNQVVSNGRPLLAEPMRWIVVANGEPQRIDATEIALQSPAPDRVGVRTGFTAGPLKIRLEGNVEVDGLYRVRLAIAGDPETTVDRFDLVIPMPSDQATLMNAITDETRIHYLGSVPAGQGVLWRATQAERWQLDEGFVPYLWVGNEDRGLAWLSESTRDFWFDPGASTAELRRLGNKVEFVIHFAPTPGRLARNREIEFALQATPVKPRPGEGDSWRRWQLACDAGEDFVSVCPLPSGFYWGTESPYGHLTPRGGDESVLGWMARARSGQVVHPPIRDWMDRHDVPPAERSIATSSLEYTMHVLSLPSKAVVAYFDAQGSSWGSEFATFSDEWRAAPFGDRDGRDEPSSRTLPTQPRASYRDRLLWYLDRMLASGAADGVFFDNTFLRASFDDHIGTAYRDDRGNLHPGVEIYALRELLQRAQGLVWKHRRAWWNLAHLTTTPISAIHGFAGFSLDGEWGYGDQDFQNRFSRERLRAEGLGTQLGTIPVWLPGIETQDDSRKEELERQLFGLTALHEIRVMDSFSGTLGDGWNRLRSQGYGDPACAIGRYWDPNPTLTVRGVDAEVLSIRCEDRITALIVGFDEGGLAELDIQGDAKDWRCRDLERRWERVDSTRGGCRVFLGRFAVRLIEMRAR